MVSTISEYMKGNVELTDDTFGLPKTHIVWAKTSKDGDKLYLSVNKKGVVSWKYKKKEATVLDFFSACAFTFNLENVDGVPDDFEAHEEQVVF